MTGRLTRWFKQLLALTLVVTMTLPQVVIAAEPTLSPAQLAWLEMPEIVLDDFDSSGFITAEQSLLQREGEFNTFTIEEQAIMLASQGINNEPAEFPPEMFDEMQDGYLLQECVATRFSELIDSAVSFSGLTEEDRAFLFWMIGLDEEIYWIAEALFTIMESDGFTLSQSGELVRIMSGGLFSYIEAQSIVESITCEIERMMEIMRFEQFARMFDIADEVNRTRLFGGGFVPRNEFAGSEIETPMMRHMARFLDISDLINPIRSDEEYSFIEAAQLAKWERLGIDPSDYEEDEIKIPPNIGGNVPMPDEQYPEDYPPTYEENETDEESQDEENNEIEDEPQVEEDTPDIEDDIYVPELDEQQPEEYSPELDEQTLVIDVSVSSDLINQLSRLDTGQFVVDTYGFTPSLIEMPALEFERLSFVYDELYSEDEASTLDLVNQLLRTEFGQFIFEEELLENEDTYIETEEETNEQEQPPTEPEEESLEYENGSTEFDNESGESGNGSTEPDEESDDENPAGSDEETDKDCDEECEEDEEYIPELDELPVVAPPTLRGSLGLENILEIRPWLNFNRDTYEHLAAMQDIFEAFTNESAFNAARQMFLNGHNVAEIEAAFALGAALQVEPTTFMLRPGTYEANSIERFFERKTIEAHFASFESVATPHFFESSAEQYMAYDFEMPQINPSMQFIQNKLPEVRYAFDVGFVTDVTQAKADELDDILEYGLAIMSLAIAPMLLVGHDEIVDNPFNLHLSAEDTICLSSGSTRFRTNVLSIPGRGGFDLNLYLKYNSSAASIPNYVWERRGEGSNNIGVGWKYDLPHLRAQSWRGSVYLPGRGTFAVSSNRVYLPLGWGRIHMPDMQFHWLGSTSGILELHDGTTYSFDWFGNINEKRDRFGNTIRFEYAGFPQFDHPLSEFFDSRHGRPLLLRRIIDSNGNVINFEYQSDGANRSITITGHDGNTFIINQGRIGPAGFNPTLDWWASGFTAGDFSLRSIQNQAGNVTNFGYSWRTTVSRSGWNQSVTAGSHHLLLSSVAYPSGALLLFGYVVETIRDPYPYCSRYFPNRFGSSQAVRVSSRRLRNGEREYQRVDFRYPDLHSARGRNEDFRTEVLQMDGSRAEQRTVYTFNYRRLNILQRTYGDWQSEWRNIPKTERITVFQGDLPTSITQIDRMGSFSRTSTQRFEYNRYRQVAATVSPLAQGSTHERYRTEIAYDNRFGLPTTTTFRPDANTTVREVNTLSPDGRRIVGTSIYENGVRQSRTEFSHDNFGNVTEIRNFPNSTGNEFIQTQITYQSGTRPSSIRTNGVRDADGNLAVGGGVVERRFMYDNMWRLIQETDPNGYITRFQYDRLGRVTRIETPTGGVATYVYNDQQNTVTHRNVLGATYVYQFHPLGMLQTKTANGAVILRNTYDNQKRLIRTENAQGIASSQVTEFSYDIWDRVVEERSLHPTTRAVLHRTTTSYYDVNDAQGNARIVTTLHGDAHAPNIQTFVQYDRFGRRTEEGTYGGRRINYTHDLAGRVIRETSMGVDNTFTHNVHGVTSVRNIEGNTARNTYDLMGRMTSSSDFMGNVSRFTYDALGRLIRQYVPFERIGNIVHYARTVYFYDRNGNLSQTATRINLPGQPYQFSWTTNTFRHNLLTSSQTGGAGVNGFRTDYTYDLAGNILTQQVGNAITRFGYNNRGQLTSTTDAMGWAETFVYDANGLLLTRTDRNGTQFRYTYDHMGRLVREEAVRGNTVANFRQYTFTATGAVHSETNGTHTVTYYYDAAGRVWRQDETGGISTRYSFNAASNITFSQTAVDGVVRLHNAYMYDIAQRVHRVESLVGGGTVTYAYDANGNRIRQTLSNGVVTDYVFNAAGLATSVTNRRGNTILSSFVYTYYLDGNIQQVVEQTLVTAVPPTITTTALPNGMVGTAYAQNLAATGANPITWSVSNGSLPAGLILNANTGAILGVPTAFGAFTFTITATNVYGSASRAFTIEIAPIPMPPVISTTILPSGRVNLQYAQTLSAVSDTPITWSVTAGALPTGLSLSADGVISGRPTVVRAFTFTVTATNAHGSVSRPFIINIAPAVVPLQLITITLPDGTVGVEYFKALEFRGEDPITIALCCCSRLPAGLSFSEEGVISGTPTVAGEFTFIVEIYNNYSSMSREFYLDISYSRTPPTIITTELPSVTVGSEYLQILEATGDATIEWEIITGALPPGLSLSTDGVISGTPTAVGAFTFTVTASNAPGSATREFTITINERTIGLAAFNNGTCTQVPSLAGSIRIWTQRFNANAPIPTRTSYPYYSVITAVDQDGNDAMQFVTVARVWANNQWQDRYNRMDVTKNAPWETITLTLTVYGETVSLLLINNLFGGTASSSASLSLMPDTLDALQLQTFESIGETPNTWSTPEDYRLNSLSLDVAATDISIEPMAANGFVLSTRTTIYTYDSARRLVEERVVSTVPSNVAGNSLVGLSSAAIAPYEVGFLAELTLNDVHDGISTSRNANPWPFEDEHLSRRRGAPAWWYEYESKRAESPMAMANLSLGTAPRELGNYINIIVQGGCHWCCMGEWMVHQWTPTGVIRIGDRTILCYDDNIVQFKFDAGEHEVLLWFTDFAVWTGSSALTVIGVHEHEQAWRKRWAFGRFNDNEYTLNISLDGTNITGIPPCHVEFFGGGDPGGNVGGETITRYTFDNRNNRATMVVTGDTNSTTTYTYDLNNRLLTKTRTEQGETPRTTIFTYDRNGNQLTQVTGNERQTHTFDAFNRLTRVERPATADSPAITAVYTYRTCVLRHSKTVNGVVTTHVWDRGNIILERNAGGAVINRFHRGNRHLISSDHHGFYLFNVRGDVVQRTNASGNVIHSYQYDAFGNQQQQGISTNPFRFAAEYYDWETGFIYLRARYLNPLTGRMISEDPLWNITNMQFGYNPVMRNDRLMPNPWAIMQSGNLFAFVMNNPVNFIDPTGLSAWLIHGTWSDPSTWEHEFKVFISNEFNINLDDVFAESWSGRNSVPDRASAARILSREIMAWHEANPNEPIRLIGHSHGGNVAILVSNILGAEGIAVDTLITIGAPVRTDVQLSSAALVGQHINVYNEFDMVQSHGGGFAGPPSAGNAAGAFAPIADRRFSGAENVRVSVSEGSRGRFASHSYMHSNQSVWERYIVNVIRR